MENFKMMFESENIYYVKLNKELINDYKSLFARVAFRSIIYPLV